MNLTIKTVIFESCIAFMQKHRTFIKEEETGKNRLEQSHEKKGMRGNEWENKVKGDKRKKRKGKKTETSIRCFQKRGSGG